MRNKSFAVLGAGKFGKSIALELADAGADVLVVDKNKERLHAVADFVTCAVSVDICDTEAMDTLGLSNMDGVVIAITGSLDVSILATIYAKEAGVPYVIAKAKDATHTKVLEKVGADQTIIPERESGIRIARHLLTGNVLNFVELSDNLRMVEIDTRPEWVGHTLRELKLREKEHFNVIAVREENGEMQVNLCPDVSLKEHSSMLITIEKKWLKHLFDK